MRDKSNIIDQVKLVCCILIIGSHCLPLFRSATGNYYYGQWFFRFCVPFFFISSGYFFSKMDYYRKITYIKRVTLIYLISTIIYLPFVVKGSIYQLISKLIFGYHHLWYLSALAIGLVIVSCINQTIKTNRKYYFILLILLGIILDEYYQIIDMRLLNNIVQILDSFGGARHALFFATPLLLVGDLIANIDNNHYYKCILIIIFIILFVFGFLESTIIRILLGENITLDISLFGWMPAIPLFLIALNIESFFPRYYSRKLRKITDIVYIIHIWIKVLVSRALNVEYLMGFFIVIVSSFIIATILDYSFNKVTNKA